MAGMDAIDRHSGDTQAGGFGLSVNGGAMRLPPGTGVAGLLERLGLDARKVAVELNEAIVPRSTYAEAVLGEGDQVEIVHFIGGG